MNIKGSFSNWTPVGPILFLIHVNDVSNVVTVHLTINFYRTTLKYMQHYNWTGRYKGVTVGYNRLKKLGADSQVSLILKITHERDKIYYF